MCLECPIFKSLVKYLQTSADVGKSFSRANSVPPLPGLASDFYYFYLWFLLILATADTEMLLLADMIHCLPLENCQGVELPFFQCTGLTFWAFMLFLFRVKLIVCMEIKEKPGQGLINVGGSLCPNYHMWSFYLETVKYELSCLMKYELLFFRKELKNAVFVKVNIISLQLNRNPFGSFFFAPIECLKKI